MAAAAVASPWASLGPDRPCQGPWGAQGSRASTTKIVAAVRGCRQGYTPTSPYLVGWVMLPGRRLRWDEEEEIG
jgi:hypothetical protein